MMDTPIGTMNDAVEDVGNDQPDEASDIDRIVMKLASEKIRDAIEE